VLLFKDVDEPPPLIGDIEDDPLPKFLGDYDGNCY
jgi:hypothetical protein